jgi:hypothetical protein
MKAKHRMIPRRATWLDHNRFTHREQNLLVALDNLVSHDYARDRDANQENCTALQYAIEMINEFAGSELYQPRK